MFFEYWLVGFAIAYVLMSGLPLLNHTKDSLNHAKESVSEETVVDQITDEQFMDYRGQTIADYYALIKR